MNNLILFFFMIVWPIICFLFGGWLRAQFSVDVSEEERTYLYKAVRKRLDSGPLSEEEENALHRLKDRLA